MAHGTLDLVGGTLAVLERVPNIKSAERLRCEDFEPGLDPLVSFGGALVAEEDVFYVCALVRGYGYCVLEEMVELPGKAWMKLEGSGIAIGQCNSGGVLCGWV